MNAMNALFLRILNLAINASWLIIAVIAARIFLNKVDILSALGIGCSAASLPGFFGECAKPSAKRKSDSGKY